MDFVHPVQSVIPGVHGRILAVLAETTAELNLRTIATIANVSQAQASRVLPGLVSVGLVERREAPPSALFRLVRDHIAAGPILALSRSRDRMIEELRRIAEELPVPPMSVVVFGSFAHGQAEAESDIDTLLVRPSGVEESDEAWSATVQQWIDQVADVSGNSVEVLEVDEDDVPARLAGKRSVWQEIKHDGLVVHGAPLGSFDSVNMVDRSRTRPVSMIQVREYLAKAEEYLLAASAGLQAERSIAATSLAIHAGINAADAVCGARLRRRAAGQDHKEAIRLLGSAGEDGVQLAGDLQRLLPMKTKAEYEPDDIPLSTATRAVERAKRCVDIARRVVQSL